VGAAQKGANCHDEMAKGISKMRDKTLAPLPIFLAILLCYLTISSNDRMEPRNGSTDQANTMKVRRELVHHHVPT
jgi:hypothetical protein